MMRRLLCLLVLLWTVVPAAGAQERILAYHSDIEVFADGTMQVAETIRVRAAQQEIKRGIYRDFPTDYRDHFGNRYRVGFEVVEVTRDGRPEDWHSEALGSGVRVYMGRRDVILERGDYSYLITYRTSRQIGYFADHDELYWNVTGNHWRLPIDAVSARVVLPPEIPGERLEPEAYSGALGAQGQDYRVSVAPDGSVHFATTRPFPQGEGLTIVVSWPKGYVHEPTPQEKIRFLLRDNLSWVILLSGLTVLLAYYLLAWVMVGRDPRAGVVITRYQPPPGVSPATARFVVQMGYDHKTFAAALVNLAVKGLLEISETGKKFTLTRTSVEAVGLVPGEQAILKHLFGALKGVSITLEPSQHVIIRKTLKAHEAALARHNEKLYFLRNRGWLIPGLLLAMLLTGGVLYALPNSELRVSGLFLTVWLIFWTLGVYVLGRKVWQAWRGLNSARDAPAAVIVTLLALPFFAAEVVVIALLASQVSAALPAALLGGAGVNLLFHYLLKAPTRAGRLLLDQLEGFRQFLDVAEREEMNFRNPPEKSPRLFERFLPYALALGVEQRWMERFAGLFAELDGRGEAYRPAWYHGNRWNLHDLGGFAGAVGNALGAAAGSSAAAPGSSSGAGGGGSSGGGGGGGGGGGW